jgi:SAM-dependent methyltransferase
MTTVYDRIGLTYRRTRRTDPRLMAAIHDALGGARTVVNVGAGSGSYEPAGTVAAIEPSRVMIAQRPFGAAPAIQASAERLPLPDDYADAAMALWTVHHWDDPAAGIEELKRVARRVVIVAWDEEVTRRFWLVREYLPQVAEYDDARAPLLTEILDMLGGEPEVRPLPVPHDCRDGFLGAFWRRPGRYLDPAVRAGISTLAALEHTLADGLARLADDLASGAWAARHADLLGRQELDIGYRVVIWECGAHEPRGSGGVRLGHASRQQVPRDDLERAGDGDRDEGAEHAEEGAAEQHGYQHDE